MISVVIPLYNKAATIERAINSVLNQTIQDFELIVVNNGSTDGGEKIVRQIDDNRLKLIEQENLGVSMARNRGIAEAQYNYIAFLDADDEWMPTFLETVLAMQEIFPECSVFATAYKKYDGNGNIQNIKLKNLPTQKIEIRDNVPAIRLKNYFEVAALSEPPFCSISVTVRKKAILAIDGFPKGVHQGEDLLTWARLASKYEIAYCPVAQSIFYTGEQSTMDIPKRQPAENDIVGRELETIYNQKPLPYLDQYIAKWHKMRASIYLRLPGKATKCRQEIRQSQRWHRNNKLFYYLIISYIPYLLRMRILKIIK